MVPASSMLAVAEAAVAHRTVAARLAHAGLCTATMMEAAGRRGDSRRATYEGTVRGGNPRNSWRVCAEGPWAQWRA
jgi:hypothetical protein